MVAYDVIIRNGAIVDDSRLPGYSSDFPGSERHLTLKPVGLPCTLVGGVGTFKDGNCTNSTAG